MEQRKVADLILFKEMELGWIHKYEV